METQVLQRRENPWLKRTEVRFRIVHPKAGTPPRDAVRAELAKALNVGKDRVVLDAMASETGRDATTGYAKVYANAEAVKALEPQHVLLRNGFIAAVKEEKPAEEKKEKPAPPPKAERPAEKPKEEKKEAKPAKEEKPSAKEKAEKPAAPAKEPKPAEKKEAKPAKVEKPKKEG